MNSYAQTYERGAAVPAISGLDMARKRLLVAVLLFCLAFVVMIARTVELGVSAPAPRVVTRVSQTAIPPVEVQRADIVDRNGDILATNLVTSSLYADAREIKNPAVVAQQLVSVLPGLSYADVEAKLSSGRAFVWLKRKLSPRQKWAVNALGVPALQFKDEEERLYPQGRLAAHVLGHVNIDGEGKGGVEHFFDSSLQVKTAGKPLQLSLDMRVQYALADELSSAMSAFQAVGAAGMVMDVNSGEVVAMVSLPDYDPNSLRGASEDALFNRVTRGVYELGSSLKTFTFAAALDQKIVDFDDTYDATKPLRVSRFTIHDDHPKKRILNVPEIFIYSSNIGTAQMALDLGTEQQQKFLADIGLLQAPMIELPEVGAPIYPASWGKTSTVTISYGHGIAISPLQLASGIAAMVNGGRLVPATLAKNTNGWQNGKQVISASTSRKVRQLMRMTVSKGTGRRAAAIGYRVGGKTGTAEKPSAGSYNEKALISSFVGAFPMDDPQYVVFALLDEPKGNKDTFGFSSGGWVAAPVVKNVIMRAAPLLGVAPRQEDEGLYQNIALMIDE